MKMLKMQKMKIFKYFYCPEMHSPGASQEPSREVHPWLPSLFAQPSLLWSFQPLPSLFAQSSLLWSFQPRARA